MLQHGAYVMLIDSCYDRENFPTFDQAMDWCWASTQEEVDAVKFILNKFFTLNGEIYEQNRIKDELQEYHGLCQTNAINGKKGGRPKTKINPSVTESVKNKTHSVNLESDSKPVVSELKPKPLTTNQEPLTKDQNLKSVPTVPTCKHNEIIQIYQELLPELPSIVIARYKGSKKETNLRARWKEDKAHQDLDFWKTFFGVVRTNPHWMGENDRGWKADFEWLLKRDNFDKVIQKGMG